jgi:hypothetical protein
VVPFIGNRVGVLREIGIGDGIIRPVDRDLLPLGQVNFLNRLIISTAA